MANLSIIVISLVLKHFAIVNILYLHFIYVT